ncbi:MAG: hypothetical protein GX555_08185 [Actinomycetales bacterium]|nr:hypothetical protein [Actinomycetales bacterium]
MNLSRISLVAAVLSAAFWAAKATAIGLAGGLGRSSLEDPLFLAGLGFHVVAVVTLVLWWTRRRHPAVRALSLVGGIAVAVAVTAAFETLLGLVKPADAGWVWGEINLWVLATVLLALTWRADRGAHAAARPAPHLAAALR